jgi:hypothetical protein
VFRLATNTEAIQMKKQRIHLMNSGDQEGTIDVLMALADMGFDVKCVMLDSVSTLQAEREFASDEPEPDTETLH